MIKATGKFQVADADRRTVWLEVLVGEDRGIRISVPKRSKAYTDSLQSDIMELEEGDIISCTVFSKDEISPNWHLASLSEQSS